VSKHRESRDHWSEDDQIFYTYGKGYGLTDKLETVCLGTEEDIEEYLATGEFDEHFNPIQRKILTGILEYRKELGIGPEHITGAAGLEREGHDGLIGRKPKTARLSKKRERLPLRPPRTKDSGLSRQ
jgi:hypothetical protein